MTTKPKPIRARMHKLPTIDGGSVDFVNLNPTGRCNCTVYMDGCRPPLPISLRRVMKQLEAWKQCKLAMSYTKNIPHEDSDLICAMVAHQRAERRSKK